MGVIGPGDLLRLRFGGSFDDFVSRVPSYVILSFFEQSIDDLKKLLGRDDLRVYNWLGSYVKVVFFSYRGSSIALLVLPLGISVSSMVLEEFIYCGALYFVVIGFAGSLLEGLLACDLVVPTYSVMDDEVFYLYRGGNLGIDRGIVYSSSMLSDLLCLSMDSGGILYHRGACWTVSSPYFECGSRVREYREGGILCVDMELASLLSISSYRGVELSSLFAISDFVSDEKWVPYFKGMNIKQVRVRLLSIVLDMYSVFR